MDLRAPPAFFRDPLGRLDLCHTCVSYSITIALLMNWFPIGQGVGMGLKENTHSSQIICAGLIKPIDRAAYCYRHVMTMFVVPVVSEGRCHERDSPSVTGTQISARARCL